MGPGFGSMGEPGQCSSLNGLPGRDAEGPLPTDGLSLAHLAALWPVALLPAAFSAVAASRSLWRGTCTPDAQAKEPAGELPVRERS